MAAKVFLFENNVWLYCSGLLYDGYGCYEGRVINGNYDIVIDTVVNVVNHGHGKHGGTHEAKLIWACDPHRALFDYNSVIEDAKKRYATGEPANYELKPKPIYEDDEEDEIPF